jgi:hypothetical protein
MHRPTYPYLIVMDESHKMPAGDMDSSSISENPRESMIFLCILSDQDRLF